MRPVYGLGVLIPVALVLDLAAAPALLVFATSAIGMVPAAALMGDATEQLAARAGPGVGGLVNVTFGNAPELIIAIFALGDGLQEVVKASLVGSIVGNSLLVLGAAMLAGGWKRTRQTFDRTAAQTQAGMLLLTVIALVLPSLLQLAHHVSLPSVSEVRRSFGPNLNHVSIAVALVLIATYLAGLYFSLSTHRDLFNPVGGGERRWRFGGGLVDPPLGRNARRRGGSRGDDERRPGRLDRPSAGELLASSPSAYAVRQASRSRLRVQPRGVKHHGWGPARGPQPPFAYTPAIRPLCL